jgi:hypothetical protein
MWEGLVPPALFDSGEQQDLFATWKPNGCEQTEAWMSHPGPSQSYLGSYDDCWDEGTGTDTSSDDGLEKTARSRHQKHE